MDCKTLLLIFLFLGITSVLWSQEYVQLQFNGISIPVEYKTIPADIAKRQRCSIFYFDNDSVMICDTMRANIINKAQDYLGVSYRYGRSSKNGFDCSGYVKFIYKIFGLDLPHSSYAQYKMSKPLKTEEAQPGDLVFFITRGKGISHVGIYMGKNKFIHSPSRGKTVSIDTLNTGYYRNHLVGFGSVF
ncbi:MAG: C40 family peptidase [Bacteroidales bacterium]|nr:C40 family peptidase [Bacteroidales bacterium]